MFDIVEVLLLLIIAWLLFKRQEGGTLANLFSRQRKIILDSCALIDGRVVEIVNTRFVADELIIPQFILNELQLLADGNDSHKRERARFGLDIAHQLQDSAPNTVTIDRTVFTQQIATDDKLVLLARRLKAQLYTTDYNLGKVAAVEGVHVLNVNELAQGLRPIALPGETLNIKIIQKGSNRDQGVGYLDDGTMIVVDGAAKHVGKIMPVTVMRMHQTVAGKMVFGRVNESDRQQLREQQHEQRSQATRQEAALFQAIESADTTPRATDQRGRSKTQQSPPGPRVQSPAPLSRTKLHSRLQRFRQRRRPVQ